MDTPEYTDLEGVFTGDLKEVTLLRSALEANGFETFIQSENTVLTMPLAPQTDGLAVTLMARKAEAADIRAAIAELHSVAPAEEGEDDLAAEEAAEEEVVEEETRSSGLWLVVLLFLLVPIIILLCTRLF